MLLNPLPQLANEPKEYNLNLPPPEKVRVRRPGQAFVFSEKDLPGYKPRAFAWDEIDEEGNPGQGRSYLYERHKRELKKKENKGRFVPYSRRPIPKQTSVTGTVAREFEAVPVKNDEYFVIENKKAEQMLRPPDRDTAVFDPRKDPSKHHIPLMTMTDRANALKVRYPYTCYALNPANRNRMRRLGNKHRRTIGPLVSTSTCLLINSSICSNSIVFGVYGISKRRSINRKLT